MVTNLTRVVAIVALYVGEGLAQTSPMPGPTVPPKTSLADILPINPTKSECAAKWRRDIRWSREEFDRACANIENTK